MITRVVISNYRSLGENVEIRLGKLTALVGPNGSGKSNVLDAVQFVADALRNGLDAAISKRGGIGAIRHREADPNATTSICITFEEDDGWFDKYFLGLSVIKDGGYRVSREMGFHGKHANLEGYDVNRAEHADLNEDVVFKLSDGQWDKKPLDVNPRVDDRGLVLPLLAADQRFRRLAQLLTSISIYSIFPDRLRGPQAVDASRLMAEHGGNWSSILHRLPREDWAPELATALGYLTGDIDGVRVQEHSGYLFAEFRHGVQSNGQTIENWFNADHESDGTLRVVGILTALFQQPPPTLIGIEEPELTIHPAVIGMLNDYLKEASERSQIVITTHSPDLLALLDADEVRVVERRHGATTVSEIDETQRDEVRSRLLTLGDLMRIERIRPNIPESTTDVGD